VLRHVYEPRICACDRVFVVNGRAGAADGVMAQACVLFRVQLDASASSYWALWRVPMVYV
jgi:hypothetical protein